MESDSANLSPLNATQEIPSAVSVATVPGNDETWATLDEAAGLLGKLPDSLRRECRDELSKRRMAQLRRNEKTGHQAWFVARSYLGNTLSSGVKLDAPTATHVARSLAHELAVLADAQARRLGAERVA